MTGSNSRAAEARRGLLALAIVSTFAVAALPPASAATATPQPAIKIGVYAPVADNPTGVSYPQLPAAVRAAVRAINRRGGFNGAKGQVVFCDTKENPNDAAGCARTFVKEGVVAVVGGFTTQGQALTPILQDAGIPNIGMVPSNAQDFTSPISFPLDAALLGGAAQALQLGRTGPKSLYVARADIAEAAIVPKFVEAAARVAGVTVTGVGSAPLGTPDLVPYASAAQASGAKAVTLIFPDSDAVKFILASDQIGYRPRFTYPEGGLTPDELKQLGHLSEGMATPGAFPPITATKQFPELKRFMSEMRAEFKAGDDGAAPKYRGGNTERPWLAVQALDMVLRTSTTKPATPASVLEGLRAAKDLDLGLIPPWTPNSAPISLFPRLSNPYQYLIAIKKGKYVLLDPKPINLAEQVNFASALSG